MSEQNYSNHKRYYTQHHFIFYPVILALAIFCIVKGCNSDELAAVWYMLAIFSVVIGWLSFMMRQHYGMTLQDRIIFTELRYRYFVITGQRFEEFEHQLSKSQLFALRFASDKELPLLTIRAVQEKLSADDIKKAVTHWTPDNGRV